MFQSNKKQSNQLELEKLSILYQGEREGDDWAA